MHSALTVSLKGETHTLMHVHQTHTHSSDGNGQQDTPSSRDLPALHPVQSEHTNCSRECVYVHVHVCVWGEEVGAGGWNMGGEVTAPHPHPHTPSPHHYGPKASTGELKGNRCRPLLPVPFFSLPWTPPSLPSPPPTPTHRTQITPCN